MVFRGCDLRRARLLRVGLGRTDLRGCRLDDIAISPDRLRGAVIEPGQADVFAAAMGLCVEPLPADEHG